MFQERQPNPDTPLGFLKQMPADVLLDRLEIPHLAVNDEGKVVYANPAFAEMIGYEPGDLDGMSVDSIIIRRPTPAKTAFEALREGGGKILGLWHRNESVVRALASKPLLLRSDDPIALVALQDVTEVLWELQRVPERPGDDFPPEE